MIAKNGKPLKTKRKLVLKTSILVSHTLHSHGLRKSLNNVNFDLHFQNLQNDPKGYWVRQS